MKRISGVKIKKELIALNAAESAIDLILNNVSLYNDLIDRYKTGEGKNNGYLLYQLNSQIVKQIDNVKKINLKLDIQPEDSFTSLIKDIRKKKVEKR
jgi:hypothetical protein